MSLLCRHPSLLAALLLLALSCKPGEDIAERDVEETDDVEHQDVSDDGWELIHGESALDLVDVFAGTKGEAFGYAALTPAVQLPFGQMRLGPDTSIGPSYVSFHHFSGYHFGDPDVRGFSHLHFIGTGVPDYGNIRVLPQRELRTGSPRNWYTTMDKASEQGSPGYYRVRLPDEEVLVELTATDHAGIHRYTFDPGARAHLTIDAGASVTSNDVIESHIEVEGARITGWATHAGAYTGRTRPFTVYFSMTVEPASDAAFVWVDGAFNEGESSAQGQQTGAVLRFDAPDRPVELRVGVSLVDLEAAEENRRVQLAQKSFEAVVQEARGVWAQKLDRVRLGGADPEVARMFYTSLYNVYRMPTRLDGADGRYRGLDGEVHETDGWAYYTDLSLWDTFRTLHPWLTLTDVDEQRDVLRSMMAMRAQGGYFPRWPAATSYTGGMLGSWADVLFAEAALKGIEGIDYADAFEGLREVAMGPTAQGHPYGGRAGIEDYIELGFVPGATHGAVSRTLEYAWGDFAIANLAEHLGLSEDEAHFRARSRYFENVFHEESRFFRPRNADGTFDLRDAPELVYMSSNGPFIEANAWHWRFYALHDPQHLVTLFGGKDPLHEALTEFFARSSLGRAGPIDTRLPDTYYWHGNEPALHSAFLFHGVDDYDALSYWVRQIQTRLYVDGPPGNDDGGTLSGWYLFNAIGLYPVAGSDLYYTSIPLAPYIEVDTDQGLLVIEAEGAAPRPQRVLSVTLNDEPVIDGLVRHDALLEGRLHFELGEIDE